jgi:hypothetical protein
MLLKKSIADTFIVVWSNLFCGSHKIDDTCLVNLVFLSISNEFVIARQYTHF